MPDVSDLVLKGLAIIAMAGIIYGVYKFGRYSARMDREEAHQRDREKWLKTRQS